MSGMYAYFNELSVYPHVPSAGVMGGLKGFADTCRVLRGYGVKKIACEGGPASIQLSESETIHSFCACNQRDLNAQLLLSVFTKPYLEEDSHQEEQFINFKYDVTIVDHIGKPKNISNPMGLAAAYLHGSFVVSFASTDFWKRMKDVPLKVNNGKTDAYKRVKNVAEPNDLDNALRDFIASKAERKWIRTSIRPDAKTISLSSDHHGNDKLRNFARQRLRCLDYFVEVSTSLEYAPRYDHFVKAIYTDTMQIDVVLFHEEKGYCMRIKTTAQNELQLRQMAQDLESRFGTADIAYVTMASSLS